MKTLLTIFLCLFPIFLVCINERTTPLSGVYTIDQNGSGSRNYTSFLTAVNELNTLGIAGPVTFNVNAGQVFDYAQNNGANAYVLKITTTGTAANPIVFQKSGTGANPRINCTGTTGTDGAGILLNGVDYITFDGIDIFDAGTTPTTHIDNGYFLLSLGTRGCNYITIRNCNINMDKTGPDQIGIVMWANNPTSVLGTHTNNKFYNNTIEDCLYGVLAAGTYQYCSDNNEIYNNTITNIGKYGVWFTYQTNLKVYSNEINNVSINSECGGIFAYGSGVTADIYNNNIQSISSTTTALSFGIWFTSGKDFNIYGNNIHGISSATGGVAGITLNDITGTSHIYKNTIYDLAYTGSGTQGNTGIWLGSAVAHNVYNNYVYDIKSPNVLTADTQPITHGIRVQGTSVAGFYHNTVYLNYSATDSNNNVSSAFTSLTSNTDLRNNIFVNMVDLSANTNSASYATALHFNSAGQIQLRLTTNNNIYYAGTPSSKHLIQKVLNSWADSTLALYKSHRTTRDMNSMTENPPFISAVSPYNLHILTGVATQIESGGTAVTAPVVVNTDFDSETRNSSFPDIGADEGNFVGSDINPPNIYFTNLTVSALLII